MNVNLAHNANFQDLAQIMGMYAALGFASWSLRVRTVAFKDQGQWFNYGTIAELEEGTLEGDRFATIRDSVAVSDFRKPLSGPLDADQLTDALVHWRALLSSSGPTSFRQHVQISRKAASIPTGSWPGWTSRLDTDQGYNQLPLPQGPFHDPKSGLFGSDIGMLAMHFLGDTRFAGTYSSSNEYELRVPDHRARIHSLRIDNSVLHMEVENPAKLQLYWIVVATPFNGQIFQARCEGGDPSAQVELPFATQKLEVWLILEDGYWIDRYEETPHYTTWGQSPSLFAASRNAEKKEILKILGGGETDVVEFKPYIQLRPQRDTKAFQILRSVSAFANAGGGSLFIGVDDEGEPTGVEVGLNREYGPAHSDADERRKAYAKDVRKLVNEGTAPPIGIEFIWHELALRQILEVRVPASSQSVYLLEKGEMYRRTNGTNRKLRPIDAAAGASPPASPFGL